MEKEDKFAADSEGRNSLELIERYNRSTISKRWYARIVKMVLFLRNFDPVGIYKPTYRHMDLARYHIYLKDEVRIEPKATDKLRERWGTFIQIGTTYVVTKYFVILIVQLMIYHQLKRQEQPPQRPQQGAGSSPHSSVKDAPEFINSSTGEQQQQDRSMQLIALLSSLLGNPFVDSTGVSIFLFSVLIASMAYTLIYLPWYYHIEPMDSLNLRLWLEPVREFKRIDLIIKERLEQFSKAARCSDYAYLINRGLSFLDPSGLSLKIGASRKVQSLIVDTLERNAWCLRPVTFSYKYHRNFHRLLLVVSFVFGSLLVAFSAVTSIYLLLAAIESKRKKSATFSLIEIVTFWELTGSLALLCVDVLLLLIIVICGTWTQQLMIQDVKHNLLLCLDEVKRMNGRASQQLKDCPEFTGTIMLKSLVKVYLTCLELRANTRFMSQMTSINVVISTTSCVSILLAESFDGSHLYTFRVLIILGLLLWVNLTTLSCAYVYNCGAKLEKIAWSLMAQLIIRSRNLENQVLFEFQLGEFWRKFILSRSFTESRMAVRPFEVKLTYERVLQINFLVISFVSLLRAY